MQATGVVTGEFMFPLRGGFKEGNFRIGVVHGLFKYTELGVVTTVAAFAIGLFIAVITMLFEATVIDLLFFSPSTKCLSSIKLWFVGNLNRGVFTF